MEKDCFMERGEGALLGCTIGLTEVVGSPPARCGITQVGWAPHSLDGLRRKCTSQQ